MNVQAQAVPSLASHVSTTSRPTTKKAVWTGRVISGVIVAFLAFDAICKVLCLPFVIEASAKLGFGTGSIFAIGVVLLACTVLYVVPRTATLGAVLLTGYLGGAVCTHVRSYEGAFPICFALTFGVLVWIGLGLRDDRVRVLFAARS